MSCKGLWMLAGAKYHENLDAAEELFPPNPVTSRHIPATRCPVVREGNRTAMMKRKRAATIMSTNGSAKTLGAGRHQLCPGTTGRTGRCPRPHRWCGRPCRWACHTIRSVQRCNGFSHTTASAVPCVPGARPRFHVGTNPRGEVTVVREPTAAPTMQERHYHFASTGRRGLRARKQITYTYAFLGVTVVPCRLPWMSKSRWRESLPRCSPILMSVSDG